MENIFSDNVACVEGDGSISTGVHHSPIEQGARRVVGKRLLDLLVGSFALALLSPLLAVLMLAVRLDSPGPALFGQERVGRLGRRFRMWKLRSMRTGSSDELHRSVARNWFEGNPLGPSGFKPEEDYRLTRIGRILRRTSLDELPQLFNVLKGDMSLVGPRPAIPYELEFYRQDYYDRLQVPPGMTGLWQVSGRDLLSAAEMMVLDLRYVREASILLDLKILLRTLATVLRRPTGARPSNVRG